jgi:hypothetical protein
MMPGAQVVHPLHGSGRVLALLPGARARVAFDDRPRLPRVVERAALGASGAPAPAPVRTPFDAATDAEAWQAIEALRLGVVPFARAEAYTVARESELAGLSALLDERQGLRLLFGDYGHGKSHLLELFEHQARAAGFATARATLDPAEVPASHPRRLYRALMAGFRCPDAPDCSPVPLFERLAESKPHYDRRGARYSRFLTPALVAHRHRASSDLRARLVDYVVGEEDVDLDDLNGRLSWLGWTSERLLAMSDYRTYGRMYAHLLGTWATWCRDAGYGGLVVLFDEVERVSALDAEQRYLAEQVLRHYAAVTLPLRHLAFDPDEEGEMYRGGKQVHRNLPLRFTRDQPLAVVMALTPAPEVDAAVRRLVRTDAVRVELPALPRRMHGALVERVCALYRQAYPAFRADDAWLHLIRDRVVAAHADAEAAPRHIVRTTVCLLDALRHGRSLPA